MPHLIGINRVGGERGAALGPLLISYGPFLHTASIGGKLNFTFLN